MRPQLRTALQRSLVALAAIIIVAVVLPYLIAPFYRFVEPVSTPMLWRSLTGKRVDQTFVPLAGIAPALPLTVILAEDASFCHNRGVDLGAIREALQQADEDIGKSRGGSTITQQVAKNLFLWQGRSFVRKALEFPLAIWLNLVLPKRRVLEDLSQHCRMGTGWRVRRRSRRPLRLRQIGPRPDRARGRGTCRRPAKPAAAQRPPAERGVAPVGRPLCGPCRRPPGARCLHPCPCPLERIPFRLNRHAL